jgi:type IV pilus assembly protein PilQ
MDRQAVYIEAGAEVPYQEKTKGGNTSTSFKKAVLSLKITPEIVAKNAINLSLQLNQDKIGQLLVSGVPTIDTRKIQTQVLVYNNETIVLGGIYEWSKVNYETYVSILGYTPINQSFFSKKEAKMERKELLIFVTPKIIS